MRECGRENFHAIQGKKIQILNQDRSSNGSNRDNVNISRSQRNYTGNDIDSMLSDFIRAYSDIVDTNIVEGATRGEKWLIAKSLEQIHTRSLIKKMENEDLKGQTRKEQGVMNKSYKDVLNTGRRALNQESGGVWMEVKRRKKRANNDNIAEATIFISKIPVDTKASEMWYLFGQTGFFKDIILPRKRDQRNNRIVLLRLVMSLKLVKL